MMQMHIENGDIRTFLENNHNTYELTTEEGKNLIALCNTCQNYNFGDEIALGPYLSEMNCIFKIETGDWIKCDRDERCGFYNATLYSSINEACVSIIKEHTNDISALDYFNSLIQKDITDEEIEQFIYGTKFSYIKQNRL